MRGFTHVGCNASASTSISAHAYRLLPKRRVLSLSSQRRILTSTSSSTFHNASPKARSPYQWSHIVHTIRACPTASRPAATAMATTSSATAAVQKRTHAGHSHAGHHHHHGDNAYLTSKNKNDPGVRITRIGLYVNLGMAIAKGAGGYVFNSKA